MRRERVVRSKLIQVMTKKSKNVRWFEAMSTESLGVRCSMCSIPLTVSLRDKPNQINAYINAAFQYMNGVFIHWLHQSDKWNVHRSIQ